MRSPVQIPSRDGSRVLVLLCGDEVGDGHLAIRNPLNLNDPAERDRAAHSPVVDPLARGAEQTGEAGLAPGQSKSFVQCRVHGRGVYTEC